MITHEFIDELFSNLQAKLPVVLHDFLARIGLIEKKLENANQSETSPPKKPIDMRSTLIKLPKLSSSAGQIGTFQSSMVFAQGRLYVVNQEPNPGPVQTNLNQQIVVRVAENTSNNGWDWVDKHVIEGMSMDDAFHNSGSIGIDRDGYLHVAANMHNMPWQYWRSVDPYDIHSWEFRGTPIGIGDLKKVKEQNIIDFDFFGTAAIPGQQITYPRFAWSKGGKLAVSYRFKIRPNLPWDQRATAMGIAWYDADTETWHEVGDGYVPVTSTEAILPPNVSEGLVKPFGFENHPSEDWSISGGKMIFDSQERMHIVYHFREGGAGVNHTRPSYAYTDDYMNFYAYDNTKYTLPVNTTNTKTYVPYIPGDEIFGTSNLSLDSHDNVFFIANNKTKPREMVILDRQTSTLSAPENTKFGATNVIVANNDVQFQLYTGVNVRARNPHGDNTWKSVISMGSTDFGSIKVLEAEETGGAFIHSFNENTNEVEIMWFNTEALSKEVS